MVDYVERFIKGLKKHKAIAFIIILFTAIILTANFLGALQDIYDVFASKTANLDLLVYRSDIVVDYSDDNTTVIGYNTTFVTQFTNTGDIPLTIMACDVFRQDQNGSLIDVRDPLAANLGYLKPNDSLNYNFTKYFEVSIPVENGIISEFMLFTSYRDNSNNIEQLWVDPFEKLD